MNAEEKIKLIQLLCASGCSYFKCQEFEIRFDSAKVKEIPKPVAQDKAVTEARTSEFNPEQTDKVLKLIDMLKSKDNDLANTIFPAGAM